MHGSMELADLADMRLMWLANAGQPCRLSRSRWLKGPSLPSRRWWPSRLSRPTCPEGWCAEELKQDHWVWSLCREGVQKDQRS